MKPVRHLLRNKHSDLWSIGPNEPVLEALKKMAEKQVGALLVLDQGQLIGILSERDYARKIALKGRSSADTPVSEIMVRELITVTPDNTRDDCLALMTDERIRHLPVLENGKLVGLLSIGDLVADVIREQRATIEQLQNYIHG